MWKYSSRPILTLPATLKEERRQKATPKGRVKEIKHQGDTKVGGMERGEVVL